MGNGDVVGAFVGESVGGVGDMVGNSVVLGERVGESVGDALGARVGDVLGARVGDSVGEFVGARVGNSVVLGERVGEAVGSRVGNGVAPTQSLHTEPGPRKVCTALPQKVSHSSSVPGENVVHISGSPIGPQQHADVLVSPVGAGVGSVGADVGSGVGMNWHGRSIMSFSFNTFDSEQ